ncbi:hypothetical protein BDZ97DRAFT_1762254 [Flammula alnicola]|nr:hypothetical protein BDZ97DRAFT_1762254 [Flammula alnicola]
MDLQRSGFISNQTRQPMDRLTRSMQSPALSIETPRAINVALPLGDNGALVETNLMALRCGELSKLCSRFRLKLHNGRTKSALVEALAKFSAVQEGEGMTFKSSVQPPYMRRHKGRRSPITPRKETKRSSLRWMEKTAASDGLSNNTDLIDTHPKSKKLVEWADAVLAHDLSISSTNTEGQASRTSDFKGYGFMMGTQEVLEKTMTDVVTKCLSSVLNPKEYQANDAIDMPLFHPPRSSDESASFSQDRLAAPAAIIVPHETDLISNYPARRARARGVQNLSLNGPRSLELAGGKILHYTAFEVPDPPAITPTDIEALASIWDDSSPYWRLRSPLSINDTAMAMKHWKAIYCRLYPNCEIWETIKETWWTCKYIMDEYHSIGPSSFWQKWSSHGSRATTNFIKSGLKKERKAAGKVAFDEIKKRDPEFIEAQSYKKRGSTITICSDSSIVRRYRKQRLGFHI